MRDGLRVSDKRGRNPAWGPAFVFRRFDSVCAAHGQDIRVRGWGFSLVKRAVRRIKGTITLHSRPGIETVFTMRVREISRGSRSPLPLLDEASCDCVRRTELYSRAECHAPPRQTRASSTMLTAWIAGTLKKRRVENKVPCNP